VADGLQRDGPQVREPVDDTLRELLLANALPFAVVGGQADQRVAQALAAVAPAAHPKCAAHRALHTAGRAAGWRSAGIANAACPSVNGP
jgi:hypothetical protein